MTAAKRRTPTQTNGGSDNGVLYTNAVDVEIGALWRYASYPLTSVGGTANAITAASDTAVVDPITSYQKGMKRSIVPALTNTGGVTIDIDGVGAVNLKSADGATLAPGDFAAGRMYGIEHDGTQFRVMAGGVASAALAFSTAPDLIVRDEKATNTAGGGVTAGSFATRTLNTIVRNVLAGVSLASNQVILQPGTYAIAWRAPAYNVGQHITRLWNATDAAEIETGSSEHSNATTVQTASEGLAVLTLTTAKAIELQHRVNTTNATNGLGLATNLGSKEVYASLYVWKVGELASQVDGIPGGALTWQQNFSTTTADADPGASTFRLNNATQNAATQIFVDVLDVGATDITTVLDSLDVSTSAIKGYIKLSKYDDPTKWLEFSFSARTSATGYRKFTITNTGSSAASPFANGDRINITVTPKGDKGDTGAQGADAGNIPWLFDSSTTMADPGSGDLRLNNATLASVTAIAISANSAASGNPSLAAWLNAWDDLGTSAARGYLVIRKTAAPQNFAIYKVTGTVVDNTTWMQLSVTHIASGGSFANTDGLSLQFTPAATDSAGWVLMQSQSVAAVSQIDFTHGAGGVVLDDTYDDYRIEYDLTVGTDDVTLELLVGTPTIQTANYKYSQYLVNDGGGNAAASSASAASMVLTSATGAAKVGNAAGEHAMGSIDFSNPESTTLQRLFRWHTSYVNAAGSIHVQIGAGSYSTTGTAATVIRIKPGSGTFSGRASIYAKRKS